MTDTPSPGASADARVHGDASALAGVFVTKLPTPHPLTSAEAEAVFQAHVIEEPAPKVTVDVGLLLPWFTSLVRWLMHGAGIWLVSRGMVQGRADALEPILTGLTLSGVSLAWSLGQKKLASLRLVRAARAHPSLVVLRR